MPKKTVLVIEDHPGERDMYGRILWYNGFHVIVAEDGNTGFRLAHERMPDLVLLDLELPQLHGLEICSRLKQDDATKHIPIVAITGRRLTEFGGNSTVLGYARFLEKPMRPLEVLRAVEEIIGPVIGHDAGEGAEPEFVRAEPQANAESAEPKQTDQSADLTSFAETLLAAIPDIIARWERLGRNEPWFPAPGERVDNLPALIAAMIRSALISPEEQAARIVVVHEAVEHGFMRRGSDFPESAIPLELHLLRQALWRQLTETFPASEEVYSAIQALDERFSIAMNASLWGFFREEITAQGRWEDALERLAGKSRTPAG